MSKLDYQSLSNPATDIGGVVGRAQAEVLRKGSDVVETTGMLLAIAAETESSGALFLKNENVTETMIRKGVEAFDRNENRANMISDAVPIP
jgi:hypothetical protein